MLVMLAHVLCQARADPPKACRGVTEKTTARTNMFTKPKATALNPKPWVEPTPELYTLSRK